MTTAKKISVAKLREILFGCSNEFSSVGSNSLPIWSSRASKAGLFASGLLPLIRKR